MVVFSNIYIFMKLENVKTLFQKWLLDYHKMKYIYIYILYETWKCQNAVLKMTFRLPWDEIYINIYIYIYI